MGSIFFSRAVVGVLFDFSPMQVTQIRLVGLRCYVMRRRVSFSFARRLVSLWFLLLFLKPSKPSLTHHYTLTAGDNMIWKESSQ